MHEMAVITDIIDVICREAKEACASRIVSVTLNVGEIRDFQEGYVQGYFDWFSRGTMAEGARITMHAIPLRYACGECGATFRYDLSTMQATPEEPGAAPLPMPTPQCPEHPNARMHIVSGNELYIGDMLVQ